MSTKIYTKTGDKGTTALIGGTKVSKSHERIEAYGTIDELNSFIGLLIDHLNAALPAPAIAPVGAPSASPHLGDSTPFLKDIQDRLFTIGSSLACDPEKETKLKIPDLNEEDITAVENAIDQMSAILPPMKFFVLPGGHIAVSTAHIARCVCRRAERACVRLQDDRLFVEPLVLRYLNRLSDYLFVLSRYAAHQLLAPETPWKPRT